ncbi:hypothetical protein SLEP1_g881 [Rubroshorea leprosula]|uniref:Transmembrane protein n=1 Tax=Rubroshorea leprosula TaxID=152421 RepID=A0AAV5HC14_9ROSI|nr:hypothetical protein SLEP1_g881 [Rubroshorea leprosula]
METHKKTGIMISLIIIIFLVSSTKPSSAASRPLEGNHNPRADYHNDQPLAFTVGRTPVPPSGASPCTYIPEGGGDCAQFLAEFSP